MADESVNNTEYSSSDESDSDDENYEEDVSTEESDTDVGDEEEEEAEPALPDPETVDRLWNEFLAPINDKKEADLKKEEVKNVTQYEFAGEKLGSSSSALETDTAKPSSSRSSYKWIGSDPSDKCREITRFGGQSVVGTNEDDYENGREIRFDIDSEGNPLPPPIRRGGLSYLSGEAEQIGLTGASGSTGLSNFLACLKNSKRQKLGTLEKSRMDWEAYKREAGIEEELQNQIKGKQGYIERQEFLQRSDLREFEIEKNVRAKIRRLN